MRKGLHIRQLESIGELRHQGGITAGDIQRIRIIRVRDQLEEAGPVDLAGSAELYLLVVLQLLAEEKGREQARRITIMIMLSLIQQVPRIIGAFPSQSKGITEITDPAAEIDISRINPARARIIAGSIGRKGGVAIFIQGISIIIIGQLLNAG